MGHTCPTCGGTGICSQCNGKGRLYLGKCTLCSGTGRCPVCRPISAEEELQNALSPPIKEHPLSAAVVPKNQICPQCGRAFDGDQCWDCLSRRADINETFSLCFPVALGGITVLNILAIGFYPPLGPGWAEIYMIPAVSFIVAVGLAFVIGNRITRYATYVRLLIVLVTFTCFIPAGFFFLNGILDGNPPREIPSRVITKQISHGTYGGPDLFVSLSWNQQAIEESFRVDRDTYSKVEPGDSVRVTIHPGAFSRPWYGKGIQSTGHDAIDLEQNRH
jgi:hypothetical protein